MNNLKTKSLEDCLAKIQGYEDFNNPVPHQLLVEKDYWLSEEEKLRNSSTYIWDTLKKEYHFGVMPEEKIRCVEETVDLLLSDDPDAERPGLLLGKIQCGKTDTFEDIIGLSFDRGIDISIILTKGTNALVEQTISRLKKDFSHFCTPKDGEKENPAHIITIDDIMVVKKSITASTVQKAKVVFVCKKEAKNLMHLTNVFKKHEFLRNKKVLIVDDEADFASRNYRAYRDVIMNKKNGKAIVERNDELAKISQLIDDFRCIPAYCRYLQVTATPYSLYLQPDGDLLLGKDNKTVRSFKPRFTRMVPIHEKYVGGEHYFVRSEDESSMFASLFRAVETPCMVTLGKRNPRVLSQGIASGKVYDLTYMLTAYFMATAIRKLQVGGGYYASSALVHTDINKSEHEWQKDIVDRLIGDIKEGLKDTTDQRLWGIIHEAYADFDNSNQKGNIHEGELNNIFFPPKEDVVREMQNILETNDYKTTIVNSDDGVRGLLDYDSGELRLSSSANIFIGGSILDRGITIKNMLCFFYGRNPKYFKQDTVLQHARMYGARSMEDMAVTRFYTTNYIYQTLKIINELDEDLRTRLQNGKDTDLVVIAYAKGVRPCNPSKIKISNVVSLKAQQRRLPIGMFTGTKREIGKTVSEIDSLIKNSPDFNNCEEDGFFEMDRETVALILEKIESTYRYDDKYDNKEFANDMCELRGAFDHCSKTPEGKKIFVMYKENREASRILPSKAFADAPEHGTNEELPAKRKAEQGTVLLLFRQKGVKKADGTGWNDAPFYWPVLFTPSKIQTVMFATNQKIKEDEEFDNYENNLDGYDNNAVLKLTYAGGDLIEHFGEVGTEYSEDTELVGVDLWAKNPGCYETRELKETTASRYLERDELGGYLLNPAVKFDVDNDHGVYSRNNDVFPFVFRPYKYMLLTCGRDAMKADQMLLELTSPDLWETVPATSEMIANLPDGHELKVYRNDRILDKNRDEVHTLDDSITCWTLMFRIRKVLRFKAKPLTDDNGPAPVEEKKRRGRFKFSMVGINVGERITFDPTGESVVVISDDTVFYRNREYKLSQFASEFMPKDKRNTSGAYQGAKYFSYKGRTLDVLRTEAENNESR